MPQIKILLAEDEPEVRLFCRRILTSAGYELVVVSDGQEAVERARRERFDLLVTDISMPHVSGLEAYRSIRSFQPDLAGVAMTGFGTMEVAIEALRLGISEFVLKPFQPAELENAVARALAKQRMERENARLKALIPLYELSRVFMSSVNLAEIPKHIVRIACEEMQADSASLMLLNDKGELTIHSAVGLPEEVINETRQKANEGVAGYVLSHREPLILQGDLDADPRFAGRRTERVASAISLPIIYKDRPLGVLNVSRTSESRPFNEGDVELLAVLGSQAAVAIENARLFREIQDAYQKLAELDHLKSEFISIASHELRSPLAVILAYAALLEEEATGAVREHLGQVVQAAMQLKSIIDEMVSLRRLDTRETQVVITAFDLEPVVRAVVADLQPLAEGKRQQVIVDLPDVLPQVKADQQVLQLILGNLLSNAIKFTPEEGEIRISVKAGEGRVVISIRDTGIGIPPEELTRIFQRFYQVEDSLRRRHGGIGLGLAIARGMAELIDGQISVESEVGRGSTFSLSLLQAS